MACAHRVKYAKTIHGWYEHSAKDCQVRCLVQFKEEFTMEVAEGEGSTTMPRESHEEGIP